MKQKKIIMIAIACVVTCSLFAGNLFYLFKIFSHTDNIPSFVTISENFTDKTVSDDHQAARAVNTALKKADLKMKVSEKDIIHVTNVDNARIYKLQQKYKGIPVWGKTMQLFVDKDNNCTGFTANAQNIENVNLDLQLSEKEIGQIVSDYTAAENVSVFDSSDYIYMNEKNKPVLAIQADTSAGSFLIDVKSKKVLIDQNEVFQETCYGKDQDTVSAEGYKKDETYYLYDAKRNIIMLDAQGKTFSDFEKQEINKDVLVPFASQDIYFGNDESEKKRKYETGVHMLHDITSVYDFYANTFNDPCHGSTIVCFNDSQNGAQKNAFCGNVSDIKHIYEKELPGFEQKGDMITVIYLNSAFCDAYEKNPEKHFDILGHEYTHQISHRLIQWQKYEQWTKNEQESSAINEAISDIFGELIEAQILQKDPDWHSEFRNYKNPAKSGLPDTIQKIKLEKAGKKWGIRKDKNNMTDYAHGASTVISHAAYLMNTGIEGKHEPIPASDLSKIWYSTMTSLSSDCTFSELKKNMDLTARTLGYSSEQIECIQAAFETVGIGSTYSNKFQLEIKDINDDAYTNYSLKITDSQTKKIVREYKDIDKDILKIKLSEGEYDFAFKDKNKKDKKFTKKLFISKKANQNFLTLHTDFGTPELAFQFDQAPVQYYNKGYLIRQDGKYGFIDNEGNYIYEPVYNSMLLSPAFNAPDDEDKIYLKENSDSYEGLNILDGTVQSIGFGSTTDGYITVADMDKKEIYQKQGWREPDSGEKTYRRLEDNEFARKTFEIYNEKDVYLGSEFANQKPYYVYVGSSQETYGPYDPDEYAFFKREILNTYNLGYEHAVLPLNTELGGLFYEKTNKGYFIHNCADTKRSKKAYSDVEWMSSQCAKVSDGKHLGIIDKNCDLIFWTDKYDDISMPLNGKVFVRKNGQWRLIETEEKIIEKHTKKKGRTVHLNFADQFEEESEEIENVFAILPEKFIYQSGAGGWSTIMSISSDGSFEGDFEDYNWQGVERTVFSGMMAPARKIKPYIYETSVSECHSTWYEDDTELPEKKDEDPYGLTNAGKLIIYLPGTPLSEIDSECIENSIDLKGHNYETIPENMYIIYNVNGKQVFANVV